jgi:hypothetical protein
MAGFLHNSKKLVAKYGGYMCKRRTIRRQLDSLSFALLTRGGVANVIQTGCPYRRGIIWVPYAKVKLEICRGLQLEHSSKLFLEVYSSKQRILEDDSVTLLIPLDRVVNSFDLLVDLLVKYLFLRYKILLLMAGPTR